MVQEVLVMAVKAKFLTNPVQFFKDDKGFMLRINGAEYITKVSIVSEIP